MFVFFFFFKQKTAYEMRISDWSSDVCSSDLGSWIWGDIAETYDVHTALLASAAIMAATPLLGRWLPMAPIDDRDKEPVELGDPEVALALTARSGPLVVEIEYRVDPAEARTYYNAMQKVQQIGRANV